MNSYLSVLATVILFTVIQPGWSQGYLPQVSPFFFLCNYHGNVQELGQQMAEVKLSVSIEANPDNYIPGKVYKSKLRYISFVATWGKKTTTKQ